MFTIVQNGSNQQKRRTPYACRCVDPRSSFRACLDDAENSLFRIEGKEVFCIVPSLVASLNDCVSNDYDIEMQKGHRNGAREQQATHEQSRSQQTLRLLSSMSRLQNFKCCPPIIMMNSYRFYWQGSHPSLLSNNVSTRSLFGPFLFEDTTIMMKDYEPPILFAICMAYALFAVDNLEFYEQKKFQRR